MLTPLLVLLRSIGLICRGHRAVALENLALRQQLAALTRTTRRPQLRTRDRLFWILLAKAWQEWRTAIMIVQPDTVVRWHRQWLRRQWTWRSTRTRPGRPTTDATVRALVGKMAAANPLWGAPRIHGELCKLGIVVSERPCRGSSGDHASRRRRRGGPSDKPCRHAGIWTSSPCQPSRAECCSCWSCSRTSVGESSPSTSRNIPRRSGQRNKSLTPFRTTRHLDGCCGIAMRSTGTCSGAESPA